MCKSNRVSLVFPLEEEIYRTGAKKFFPEKMITVVAVPPLAGRFLSFAPIYIFPTIALALDLGSYCHKQQGEITFWTFKNE